ncbi:MAG: ABC transporter permease [Anaerolineae bacterium]|nr:ABC transporter permease [Anaerolineae bacterium]
MTKFIIRRLLQAIPTFFGITLLSYMIMVLAPGNPVAIMTFDPNMTQEQRADMERRLGVNDPWPLQYLRWLVGDDWMVVEEIDWYKMQLEDGSEGWLSEKQVVVDPETGAISLLASRQPYRTDPTDSAEIIGRIGRNETLTVVDQVEEDVRGGNYGILRGDFGRSFRYKEPPLKLIGERIGATLELNVMVILTGMTIGITLGVLAAVFRGSWFDSATRVLAVIGDSVPSFWLAFMFILIFAAPTLDILPMGGRCGHTRGGCGPVFERLEYLVLPTLVLALGGIAGWSRYMRASMLENINADYIRTAKSKGLQRRTIWFKHAMRNALIPMATFLGPTIVSLLSGAVIIEQIFAWPGIGRLYLQALGGQDYPVVMASVVIGAILTIIGYLISDILYAVFDPRIRL